MSLTALIHGESGHGKSWLARSTPGPRLFIDVESRAEMLVGDKVWWDPRSQPLPTHHADGTPIHTDTTVVVNVRTFPDFKQVYSWLASGNHYFRSVIIDSISELQEKCMKMIVNGSIAQQRDWGILLQEMGDLILDYKDLRAHPTTPIECFVAVSGTSMRDGKFRPLLQGALKDRIVYKFDLVGFLSFEYDVQTQTSRRVLAIQPYGPFEAKDNTHRLSVAYGIQIVNPSFDQMLAVVNGVPA